MFDLLIGFWTAIDLIGRAIVSLGVVAAIILFIGWLRCALG